MITVELPPADESRRGGRRQDPLVRDDDTLEAIAGRQLQDDLRKRRTMLSIVRLRVSAADVGSGRACCCVQARAQHMAAPMSQSNSRLVDDRCAVMLESALLSE